MSTRVQIVNVSGGKDSDCCYLLAMQRGRPFRAIFSDTGNEHPWTYEHVQRIHERTGGPKVEWVKKDFSAAIARRRERLPAQWTAAGVPQSFIDRALEVLHPTGVPYLDLVLSKGMFCASGMRKFCTEELKIRPTDEQIIKPLLEAGIPVTQWLGIRSDESKKRADTDRHPKFQRSSRLLLSFRPILNYTIRDVIELHKRHDLPMNPLYKLGFTRVGCFPCINASKNEMALITRHHSEHIDRIREWEALCSAVNVSWRRPEGFGDINTFFAIGKVPGLHRNTVDDVALWSTTIRGGRMQDMFAGDRAEGILADEGHYACTGGTGWCESVGGED